MTIFFIVIIILIVIYFLLIGTGNNNNNDQCTENKIVLSKYITNKYVMTQTELIFYRELKTITDKLGLIIFPQVDLKSIIQIKEKNDITSLNKINRKSIDYTIVEKNNCKIVCCIELNDYTHNRQSRKESDKFKEKIFEEVNIPLFREEVKYKYDLEKIENQIKQCIENKI